MVPPLLLADQHRHQRHDRDRNHEAQHDGGELVERVVVLRAEDHVGDVRDVVREEQQAPTPADPATEHEHRQAGQRHGDHHPEIEVEDRRGNAESVAAHQPRQSQAAEDVERIAADHVADRDVALAAHGRHDRRGDLRHGRAGRDDGEADDEVAHAECTRERHRGVHQPVRADDEQCEPDEDEQQLNGPVTIPATGPACLPLELAAGLGGLRARLPDEEHDVAGQQRQQQRRLPAPEPAIDRHHREQHRGTDHDRHLLADDLRMDDQRRDQRAEAEDEQHVEDVAADDIADGDVGAAIQHGTDGHRDFGRAGAECDDREPDHERRDAERQRELRGAAHEGLGAGHEGCKAQQEK